MAKICWLGGVTGSHLWWQKMVLVGLSGLWFWLGMFAPSYALIRTIPETPNQVVIQARHQLPDEERLTWQVILFARPHQLQLRLVGFPERYHFRHPQPLVLTTPDGQTWLAADDFPKAATVANVGQFDLLPLADELLPERFPPKQPLRVTLPLVEGERHLTIPTAVLLEWQEVIHQGKKLGA